MISTNKQSLLKNQRVLEEIHRHLWIESEKAGYDIGFDQAANDWLSRFADDWMKYNQPKKNAENKTATTSSKTTQAIRTPRTTKSAGTVQRSNRKKFK